MNLKRSLAALRHNMFTPRGKDAIVFCIFLGISAVLWLAMTLNEPVQKDVRCELRIVNCPDTVTRISMMPEAANVNVKTVGTELFMLQLRHNPVIDIDYKHYLKNGEINLSPADMRAAARSLFGQNSQIISINPDTLHLRFTSKPPVRMPVTVDARVSTLPNCAILGVKSLTDSVMVYSAGAIPDGMRTVTTSPLRLTEVAHSQTVRVRLNTPAGCRAIPDSVDVQINVEPMISRSANVPIRTINVPSNYKLILMPSTVKVNYMQPMSKYDDTKPRFQVTADFNSLDRNFSSPRIHIALTYAKGNFINTYLSTDSVSYIVERRD